MKKKIFWLIQTNQVTPIIIDFLSSFKKRVEQVIDLIFMVPESSRNIHEVIKCLEPEFFKDSTQSASTSYQLYLSKVAAMGNQTFSDGLGFADTLILDDLGGGNTARTILDIPCLDDLAGIMLQIPTPLGSSDTEERIFQSAVLWGRTNKIPVIGYELLPLDTRWILAPSLPDGVITRYLESYQVLADQLGHSNIWLLPDYEASVFSSVSTNFNLNGARATYHYKKEHAVHASKTVLYLPHNVAMLYEYQQLLRAVQSLGSRIHLMFSYGEDQVRGIYSQKEMIEIIYARELKSFSSFSFHKANCPWEMMMADAVLSCASCFNTQIASKELPCIIYDSELQPFEGGNKIRVSTEKGLLEAVKQITALHSLKTELADILILLAKTGGPYGC